MTTNEFNNTDPLIHLDSYGATSYGYGAFGNLSVQTHTELNVAYGTRRPEEGWCKKVVMNAANCAE